MRLKTILPLLLILMAASSALAYKEPIHRVISVKAFDRSTADFPAHLGIARNAVLNGIQFRGLIAQGADDEDQGTNALHHFFDGQNGEALSVPFTNCIPLPEGAQAWCLDGTFNSFSTRAARGYYRAALTASNKAARDSYLRELALSLGHQIHLVQDMAQPEHTRNDQHLIHSEQYVGGGVAASMYEEWGLVNLVGLNGAVSYDGYPNVHFATAADYFANSANNGMAQFASRNFVTQDTNYDDEPGPQRCTVHPLPRVADAIPRTVTVNEAVLQFNPATEIFDIVILPIEERIFLSLPMDRYTGLQEVDPNHTFLSSLDFETRMLTGQVKYSLADQSLLSRAALLMPRAVGYSAGFLDHFFRGKIDAKWKRSPVNSNAWEITITNLSAEPIGADAKIHALYEPGSTYLGFPPGSDIGIIAAGPITDFVPGFGGLAPGASVTLPPLFVPSLHPGDAPTRFERRIVISGALGAEQDDVIGLVQPGYGKGLTFEVTWDNDARIATQIYTPYTGEYERACSWPCGPDPVYPNIRPIVEEPGRVAINLDLPVPSDEKWATYIWRLNQTPATPEFPSAGQIRATLYRDGAVISEQVLTLRPWPFDAEVILGTFP